MTDRRLTAANDRVAAQALQGQVDAASYVVGQACQVTVPVADLCATPNGLRDRQLLLGDMVQLFEVRAGWGFVQSEKDGYVGYLAAGQYDAPQVPTHWVSAAATHLYPDADLRTPETTELSLGAHVTVGGTQGAFSQTRFGWIPSVHLSARSARPNDLVAFEVRWWAEVAVERKGRRGRRRVRDGGRETWLQTRVHFQNARRKRVTLHAAGV